jgi:hypothetical protein
MAWQPSSRYRYAFSKGMTGADVWALQINLAAIAPGIDMDGNFGPITEAAVRNFQGKHGLTVDGVAGIVTQRSMCLTLSQPATDKYRLPDGLLKGLMENESGYAVAAFSAHPSDAGFDLGPYQKSFSSPRGSQTEYAHAYSAKAMADDTGRNSRQQKDNYRRAPKVTTDKYAWQLGVLSHNWPLAAENLSRYGSIFRDPSQDNVTQEWIVKASGGTLHTARQWVDHYIAKGCVYITSWPA